MPWKAHFLGWLFSDGNVDKHLQRVTLALAETDRHVLEHFAMKIYGNTRILRANAPHSMVDPNGTGRVYNCQAQHFLRINSVAVAHDLLAKGLVPAKSLILRFPTRDVVPDHLVWHFVRGYFEGDGTVRNPTHRARGEASLLGTWDFMQELARRLSAERVTTTIRKKGKIWSLHICGLENLIRFSNLIYADADFTLKRKKDRFDALIQCRDRARPFNKTSRFNGVCFVKRLKRWVARATVDGIRQHIACYDTEQAAFEGRRAFLRSRGLYEGIVA